MCLKVTFLTFAIPKGFAVGTIQDKVGVKFPAIIEYG